MTGNRWYDRGQAMLMGGHIDWVDDPVYFMLMGPDFRFDSGHEVVADLAGLEAAGPGYTPGGLPLVGKRVVDRRGYRRHLFADDARWMTGWTTRRLRAVAGVIYLHAADPADRTPIAAIGFGGLAADGAKSIRVQWDERDGIANWSYIPADDPGVLRLAAARAETTRVVELLKGGR